MIFLTLLIFPVLVALVLFFVGKHTITLKEFLIHIAAQVLVAGASVGIIYWMDTSDTEIWNGRITNKRKVQVPCSHSYQCNCRPSCSGSGKNRTCTTVCDTCYRHLFDFDWRLYLSTNETINIRRVNEQGTREPPRFTRAKIGEPTSTAHSYTNYIKGSSDSLFKKHGLVEQFKGAFPPYPGSIYDYHRLDRAIGVPKDWSLALSELNADLGAIKQVNIIFIATTQKDSMFGEALEQKWLGGKKNDVVAIVGTSGKTIKWAYVIAWTDKELFKVSLRDALMEVGELDKDKVMKAIRTNVSKHYVRKPMADFEYLRASITPSVLQWVIAMLIGLVISGILGFVFWKHDI